MKLFLVIAVLFVVRKVIIFHEFMWLYTFVLWYFKSASAAPPVPPRTYIVTDSDDSDQNANWQLVAQKKAKNEYENAGRKLFQAYENIEQKMMQIEYLAKNFIEASKNYVKNQHDVNTKTYVRALETLESHKKAADMLANKIKETSDKVAQYGSITTTLAPCSKPTPTAANLETASVSTTAILETASIPTTAILETASITTPTVGITKISEVAIPLPIAIESTTVNGDAIFADSLKNLNLNYNNVLQNIGEKAIETDEDNTVPTVAVLL